MRSCEAAEPRRRSGVEKLVSVMILRLPSRCRMGPNLERPPDHHCPGCHHQERPRRAVAQAEHAPLVHQPPETHDISQTPDRRFPRRAG